MYESQLFVPKFLKKTVQAAAAAFLLASTASFGTQGSSSLFAHRQGLSETPPPKIACPLSSCCFYFECSTYSLASFPLHHSWRSPPRIFPPSRHFTPLCHHPGAESCTSLLNTGLSVCTRYTSCCTSFKSIIINFLYGFAISNVACTYICLPKETMPCCRVARGCDTCSATHGTGYVVPIASHSPVLKTDPAERDPSCAGCGNRAG